MLNRQNAPILELPEKINIPEPEVVYINNEIPVIVVNEGTQEVVKIELIFAAGTIMEQFPLLSLAANDLIDEGTTTRSSAQLAEELDNFGAYLQTECGSDFATVTLYTLSKFIPDTLPLLMDIVCNPTYNENEINTFSVQGKQRLTVNLEKVDFLARRHFIKALYGENHAYGHFPTVEDYNILNSNDLKKFHKENYLNGLCNVVIAGKFAADQLTLVLNSLNSVGFKKGEIKNETSGSIKSDQQKINLSKPNAVQSAIRIGRVLFNRTHKDYFNFSILNTILGGYFGSRLMSNIREDKGYTYGIGSGLMSLKNNGYFFISTEVGADVSADAVKEIYFEVNRLLNEEVSFEELELVKNYLFGAFQRSMDGPFSIADRYKTLFLNNLSTDHYRNYLRVLSEIDSEKLLKTANLYLDPVHLTEVIIGP